MALPFRTTGSLRPAFAPARTVTLAVKLAYAFALTSRCPTVISQPSCSSVTLWEETAPVKLPTRHCPQPGLRVYVRISNIKGWYFKDGSIRTGVRISMPPTYPAHQGSIFSVKLQQRFTGSFRLAAGTLHLHSDFNFTESRVETAWPSLRHSCRSELTRQGISLPQDRYPGCGQCLVGSLTGAVSSQRVTEEHEGQLITVGHREVSAKAQASLTARVTVRAGAKAGLSDPVVLNGRAIAQRIKGTPGITG
eukprot:TRINITY_DN1278_c0_g1_i11.p1 TRINITY_DN1278_c0_g1~~TRINITY_DN1278_c0_g1_i11.p1  ORF type:complete len:250 (+),score=-32.26 TRINITY_DN1278_c0_g1_i11:70-819(+)